MTATPLRIAMTGGTGFAGKHLSRKLLALGHHPRLLVRNRQRVPHDLESLEQVGGDLFDEPALLSLCDGVDAVIHLVGIIAEVPARGQTFEAVHVEGTRRILAAAEAAEVGRFVHMSALGARSDSPSAYHQTKAAAEALVRESSLPHTIFRPSIIHGADGEFTQMLNGLWRSRLPPFVPYFGRGITGFATPSRVQPVWVDDVAHCFAHAATTEQTTGKTYDLGGPEAMTWPQMYRAVQRHLPGARRKPIVPIPAWKAKLLAHLPGVPFTRDQVIMAEEDSICDPGPIERDFDIRLRPFEDALAEYAAEL